MILDEALDRCEGQKEPIGNRVDGKEALIKPMSEKNRFCLIESRPWSIGLDRLIGERLTKEEIKIRIADISFASDLDRNRWVVNPERW